MVASLPPNIQLKLAQTLAQWRQWHCDPRLPRAPVPVKVLSDGLSNFSVLVEAERQFVVRIDGVNPAAHGLSRQGEWSALLSAHAAGLAPRPRYFNPELGSLVCDFLPPDKRGQPDLPDLAKLLRGIHQLPPRHHRLDLAERILSYEKQLEHRAHPAAAELTRFHPALAALLDKLQDQVQAMTLCHNDLLPANRLYSGGRLWAIDWEYCAMGSPWYDIAVAVTGDSLNHEQIGQVLEVYLDTAPSAGQFHRLRQYGCVYRYLELLWYLVIGQGLSEKVFGDKLGQLEQALLEVGTNP